MKTKQLYKITIEAEYASEFQEETGDRALTTMIQAWELHMNSAHKHNNVYVLVEKKGLND